MEKWRDRGRGRGERERQGERERREGEGRRRKGGTGGEGEEKGRGERENGARGIWLREGGEEGRVCLFRLTLFPLSLLSNVNVEVVSVDHQSTTEAPPEHTL